MIFFFLGKTRKRNGRSIRESRADRRTVTEDGCSIGSSAIGFEAYGTNYQQKTELLSELHQYAEGTYTIFPTPEVEQSFAEPSGHQMTMFDFWDTKAVAEPTVVDMSDVEE